MNKPMPGRFVQGRFQKSARRSTHLYDFDEKVEKKIKKILSPTAPEVSAFGHRQANPQNAPKTAQKQPFRCIGFTWVENNKKNESEHVMRTATVWPSGLIENHPDPQKKKKHTPRGPGTQARGDITDFSYSAKRRLQETLGKLDEIGTFFTLNPDDSAYRRTKTKPGETRFQAKIRVSKRCLKRIEKQIFAPRNIASKWRMGIEIRTSGVFKNELAPHFHMVLDKRFTEGEKAEIIREMLKVFQVTSTAWNNAEKYMCDFRDVGRTKTDRDRVTNYMCRPLSQEVKAALNGHKIGKCTGSFGDFKQATPETVMLDDEEEGAWCRYQRKYLEKKYRNMTGKKLPAHMKMAVTDPSQGFSVFLDADVMMRIYWMIKRNTAEKKARQEKELFMDILQATIQKKAA